MRTVLLAGTALLAIALAAPAQSQDLFAFDPLPPPVLRASRRRVFAHYLPPFPISIDNKPAAEDYYTTQYLSPDGEHGKYRASGGFLRERPLPRSPRPEANWSDLDLEAEVRRAIAIGLDGFACDILSSSGTQWDRVRALLRAARRVDRHFRIMLMPDMTAEFSSKPRRLRTAILRLAHHPSVLRMPNGRVVVAPFAAERQSPRWWRTWLGQMRARGMDVAFVPVFLGWRDRLAAFAPISTGVGDWGVRTPFGSARLDAAAAIVHDAGALWMAPVGPQDMRPKDLRYWEAGNSEALRRSWQSAIETGADWVQVVTWNDYSESTEISPSSGTQHAFYDLTSYYVAWFKTGQAPPIVRDVLCWFHRVQATAAMPEPAEQSHPFELRTEEPPRDEVELLAFLTAPGTLEIALGGETHQADAPAGVTSLRVALQPGAPTFSLRRDGVEVLSRTSPWTIGDPVLRQDLLYRGGCSNRALVE